MARAGVYGPHACPKGLHHGFGVHAVLYSGSMHLLQRWLWHTRLETTPTYADVGGPDEIAVADGLW